MIKGENRMPRSAIRAGMVVAVVLSAGMGLGACASGAPEGAGGQTSVVDTAPFVECMRAHDLPDFPDVTVSSDGLVNFEIDGERVDTASERYGAALKACEILLPRGSRLPGAPGAPAAP
jgi:hypothetical protein